MVSRRASWAAGVALAIALGASFAHAEPSATEKESARALVKSGRVKRSGGDFVGALTDFQSAHAIMHIPPTGLELGRTLAAMGKFVEARDTLVDVTHMPSSPSDPPSFEKARHEAKQLADGLLPRLATLRLTLTGVPEGTTPQVTIDGTRISAESLGAPLKVNPGLHTIVGTIGSEDQQSQFEVLEGGSRDVALSFSGRAATPAPAAPPPTTPPPPPTRTSPLVYAGFITAGVGVAVGTVTGILTFTRYSQVQSKCVAKQCPQQTYSDIDTGRTLGTVSTIAFIVAGVGAAVGVVGLLMPVRVETRTGSAIWLTGDGVRGVF